MSITFIEPRWLWLLALIPPLLAIGVLGGRAQSPRRLWTSLALRFLILTSLILALAGIQLRWQSDVLTTVFVLDYSESLPASERAFGEQYIREAIAARPKGIDGNAADQAAIVIFGRDALVERLPSDLQDVAQIASVPDPTRTDLASALQLAQAILPAEGARRIVLLSDGRQNIGQAVQQAELAASAGIEMLYVPLGSPQAEAEVLVDSLTAPAEVRAGQKFSLRVVIESNAALGADLQIFEENQLIHSQAVQLQPGRNEFSVPIEASSGQGGGSFRRFRAVAIPEADTRLQNNEAGAFTVVYGPPAILLVEGQPGEAADLAAALEAANMQTATVSPSEMPTRLSELAGYEVVVLANVPAKNLPPGMQETLQVYVRDLGKGLLMLGGPDSFGAGGYLRSPLEETLPVSMEVRDKELQSNLALVLAVDKSGSMGRCHCDNPDLNQSYTRMESGQPKTDIAKEAIMRASGALGSQDYLGVVTFDSQPRWALELGPLADQLSLEQAISSFQAEGQTNLQAGVQEAYKALQNVEARRKHIILMTDGWVRTGDLTALAQQMEAEGITLSIVAAGGGSAQYLSSLAAIAGGQYYPAVSSLSVPDIFLKETIKSAGKYIIEEPFYPLPAMPGPVFTGIGTNNLPYLLGYNGTTPKNTARTDLITPRGDPLLSSWQYGLGRSAAWTSDMKGQWAAPWIGWDQYPQFAAQLVGSLLPTPKSPGLDARASLTAGQAIIDLQAMDEAGQPLNGLTGSARLVGPDEQAMDAELVQVGAGQYQATADLSQPGAYLVRLGVNQGDQSLGQAALGLVVPYSPEYRLSGIDRALLSLLSITSRGNAQPAEGETNPGEITPANPAAAFERSIYLTKLSSAKEISWYLLLFAVLLFPLDVAVRRLLINREDLRQAWRWSLARLPGRHAEAAPAPRVMGQLFEARDRARRRDRETDRSPSPTIPEQPSGEDRAAPSPAPPPDAPTPAVKAPPTPSEPSAAAPPPATPDSSGDSLARLREAKKRARRN